MAAEVDIYNRALQKLGAKRISSPTEDSTAARACHAAYEMVRDAELEDHPWNFAIQRFQLAADAESPAFGKSNAFTFPSQGIRPLPPDAEYNSHDRDWIVEGRKILTNDSGPLEVRFIMQVTDINLMSPLFKEAVATRMALELCETLTQSNTKKTELKDDYEKVIRRARKANAFANVPIVSATDSWITGRA